MSAPAPRLPSPWLLLVALLYWTGAAAGGQALQTRLDRELKPRPPTEATPPPAAISRDGGLRLSAATALGALATPPSADEQGHASALLFEAIARHRLGDWRQAEQLYHQATTLPNPPVEAHLGLARLIARRAGPQAAAQHLAATYARAPDRRLAAEIARWWVAADRHALARTWLAQAGEDLPAEDHALLAVLHLLHGDVAEAGHAYRRALDKDASRPAWWLGLGIALEAQGDTDAARTAYRRALDLPGLPPEAVAYARAREPEAASQPAEPRPRARLALQTGR